MSRRATVMLEQTAWSGWDGGHTCTKSGRFYVLEGTVLNPETLGESKAGYAGCEALFYQLLTVKITDFRVDFTYRRLVIDNPGGSIDLTAPNFGGFTLLCGDTKKLSTPTMDGGTGVKITLHEIAPYVPAPAGEAP